MLRRRLAKDGASEPSDARDASESHSKSQSQSQSPPPKPKKESFVTKPRSKRRNGLIFVLGGLFGVLVAVLFANQQDVINLDGLMDLNL